MRGAWLSTFSRDAMRIMCLSLAGHWWRAEWETGLLLCVLSRVASPSGQQRQSGLSPFFTIFSDFKPNFVYSFPIFCQFFLSEEELCPSGVTGRGQGGRVPPRDFWPGNFCWPTGKRQASKKGKMEQKGRKSEKGKVENWKWKEERLQNEERTFFFYQDGNFLPGKSISRRGKNQEKWLCPLWKIFLLHPCLPPLPPCQLHHCVYLTIDPRSLIM